MLSYVLRCGLNYFIVQLLLSFCVKVEIIVRIPYLAVRVVWLCFVFIYSFWLCLAIVRYNIFFLTLSKMLFTLAVIYYRLRVSFFNTEALGLAINDTITFGECFSFIDKSLIVASNFDNISVSSALSSKLSSRTNHLILPFLIQARGMSTKAAGETMARSFWDLFSQNTGAFLTFGAATIGGAVSIHYEATQNNLNREANAEIARNQIAATASENLLNREASKESEAQKQNSNSLAMAEKRQHDVHNQWFPRETAIKSADERVAYHSGLGQEKPTTSVALYKETEVTQLRKGGLVKDTLNEQSFLTPPASENVVSVVKSTSAFIPSPLDLAKDSIVTAHILKEIYKMLFFWL